MEEYVEDIGGSGTVSDNFVNAIADRLKELMPGLLWGGFGSVFELGAEDWDNYNPTIERL